MLPNAIPRSAGRVAALALMTALALAVFSRGAWGAGESFMRVQATAPAETTPSTTGPAPSTTAPSTTGPAPTARPTTRTDRVEARIRELHSKLKITPAQEAQWNAVAQVMRDNAKHMEDLTKARAAKANMNAVDDLQSYSDIIAAHDEGIKKFIPAFENLYSSMSPEQKKTADELFRQRRARMAAHRGARKGSS